MRPESPTLVYMILNVKVVDLDVVFMGTVLLPFPFNTPIQYSCSLNGKGSFKICSIDGLSLISVLF